MQENNLRIKVFIFESNETCFYDWFYFLDMVMIFQLLVYVHFFHSPKTREFAIIPRSNFFLCYFFSPLIKVFLYTILMCDLDILFLTLE